MKCTYKIPALPISDDLETKPVLKAVAEAHRRLAELKGRAATIPNQGVLLDTLSLQEANASSEIENIVTTQDDLFKTSSELNEYPSAAAKEVSNYVEALTCGYQGLRDKGGLISNNLIISMFQVLKKTDAGYRKTPGTALKNDQTGEIVYVPPQAANEIEMHMSKLELYINQPPEDDDLDILIKLAVIHHQFESIHPFSDGNGRLGRLINVLYLIKEDLLDIPVLYLSRYITQNKSEYYRLLQYTRDTSDWEPWILFILDAIKSTSVYTTTLIADIRTLMAECKTRLRNEHASIYSQDLLNNLFKHPYTRIEFVIRELGVSRPTATRYLNALSATGVVRKVRYGIRNYYINEPLVELFVDGNT